MKSIPITLTFLEPYRILPWAEKGKRDKKEYLRGANYVRLHKDKNGKFKPYITGTLIRSAVLSAIEMLLDITNGEWNGKECCLAKFHTEGEKPSFLRKKPIYIRAEKDEICTSRETACPLCLILGRFDKAEKKEKDKEKFDVHFSNLNLYSSKEFSTIEELAPKRALNRIEQYTGKAQDYFTVYEALNKEFWTFKGRIRIKEDIYDKVTDLLFSALRCVEKIAGALCRIEIDKEPSQQKGFVKRQLSKQAKEDIEKIFQVVKDAQKLRLLSDCFRELTRMANKDELALPLGPEDDGHYLWDKIKVEGKTLRIFLRNCFSQYKDNWLCFCDEASKKGYQKYREKRHKLTDRELPTATPKHFAEKKDPQISPIYIDKDDKVYEWIIVGRLIAQTPFHFGDEEKAEGAILLTPDNRFRLPRTALRGILRRDLKLAGASACEVEVGRSEPCPCDVCKIMRRVTLLDTVSEDLRDFLPELRKRIRINPQSGTVAEGALFDTEVGPEGLSFPFVLRYKCEKLPDSLTTVLCWWQEGLAFLSGESATGKGRFRLEINGAFVWDLQKGLFNYIKNHGFRGEERLFLEGNEAELEKMGIQINTELLQPEMIKKEKNFTDFPYDLIKYQLNISSPLLLNDPIRAIALYEGEGKAPDAVFFKKYVFENGKIEEKPCFKAESIRGIFRTAVGRIKNVLTKNHEDCICVLCHLFGNVHETGRLKFEDLKIVSGQEEKFFDHVAIDRFLGGAKEKYKFDDKPIIGAPDTPIVLEGKIWVKKDINDEAKETLSQAFSDINTGIYYLGANGSIGYGWIEEVKALKAPSWLKIKEKPNFEKDTSLNISAIMNEFKKDIQTLNLDKTYLPYGFLKLLEKVKRTSSPITHERFYENHLTGFIECSLKVLSPLIIPDTETPEKEENGHKYYHFLKIDNKPIIPGAEIRGAVSSIYEALTNSCFRVFGEKKVLSWRMEGKDAKEFMPGRVSKKKGKLYMVKMQALRLPVYDNPALANEIRSGSIYEKYKNSKVEIIFFQTVEGIRKFLRGNFNNVEWKKVLVTGIDPLAILPSQKIPGNDKWVKNLQSKISPVRGYFKFTGPNKIETKRREEEKDEKLRTKANKVSCLQKDKWYEAMHNHVEYKQDYTPPNSPKTEPLERPRNIPCFVCSDKEKIYRMTKRCERVFVSLGENAPKYEIPISAIKRYEVILSAYRENWERNKTPELFRTRLPGDGRTLNEDDLVYFRADENEKVKDIIPVCISRIVDEVPLIKRLSQELWPCVLAECPLLGFECKKCELEGLPEKIWFRINKDGLCPACRLFGTQIYKSRVRFSFAYAKNWKFYDGYITLPRLESPRATWLILKEKDKHYIKYKVCGRKFYLHNSTYEDIINNSKKEKEKKTENNASFEVLKEGEFTFKVYFENLENWELGLLLLSLTGLGEAIKIGHAKPLGFGSVKIEAKKIYFREEAGKFHPCEKADEYLKKGLNKLTSWFGKNEINEHMRNLLLFMTYYQNLPKVKYPDFDGYAKWRCSYVEQDKVEYFQNRWIVAS